MVPESNWGKLLAYALNEASNLVSAIIAIGVLIVIGKRIYSKLINKPKPPSKEAQLRDLRKIEEENHLETLKSRGTYLGSGLSSFRELFDKWERDGTLDKWERDGTLDKITGYAKKKGQDIGEYLKDAGFDKYTVKTLAAWIKRREAERKSTEQLAQDLAIKGVESGKSPVQSLVEKVDTGAPPLFMNRKQRVVLFLTAIFMIIMLLFPPFHFQWVRGMVLNLGYGFLFVPRVYDDRYAGTVNVGLLIVELLVAVLVGGTVTVALKDVKVSKRNLGDKDVNIT